MDQSFRRPSWLKERAGKSRGQTLVEFAIILPILLASILLIIELGRLFFAWMAVENGARYGIRYAITREFDTSNCPGGSCDTDNEEESARLVSIEEAARAGSTGVRANDAVTDPTQSGFYDVIICPPDRLVPPLTTGDHYTCAGGESSGAPGEKLIVVVDHNHELITPFITAIWPNLRLSVQRESIVETYRYAVAAEAVMGETLPDPGAPPPVSETGPESASCDDPDVQALVTRRSGDPNGLYMQFGSIGVLDSQYVMVSLRNTSTDMPAWWTYLEYECMDRCPASGYIEAFWHRVTGSDWTTLATFGSSVGTQGPVSQTLDPPIGLGPGSSGQYFAVVYSQANVNQDPAGDIRVRFAGRQIYQLPDGRYTDECEVEAFAYASSGPGHIADDDGGGRSGGGSGVVIDPLDPPPPGGGGGEPPPPPPD